MILADVIGTVASPSETIPFLDGRRMLLIRAIHPRTGEPMDGAPRIALDNGIGAGPGDRVLVIDEGNSSRQITETRETPVKTMIVGFVDAVETNEASGKDAR